MKRLLLLCILAGATLGYFMRSAFTATAAAATAPQYKVSHVDGTTIDEYQNTLNANAKQGWYFVQMLPMEGTMGGRVVIFSNVPPK